MDDFHSRNAAMIASYTGGLGQFDNDHADVLQFLNGRGLEPDFVTGADPYRYPCRYPFTPFVMIVDLNTAEILYKQDDESGFESDVYLDLMEQANQ
jgi:hypothetical protein